MVDYTKDYEPTDIKKLEYETFSISINDCVALCYIVDEFEQFCSNFKEFINNNGKSISRKLSDAIIQGKKINKLKNKSLKEFYDNNYNVLSFIHKYTYISNFLLLHHCNGNFDNNIILMHQYIKNNRDKIFNILAILGQLKRLGFNSFKFNEYLDFGSQIYSYDTSYKHDYNYLDGDIIVYPNYDSSIIKYKSNNANYNMKISMFSGDPSRISSEITLNNLTFDGLCLPSELTYEETMGRLLTIKKYNEKADKVVQDSAYLDYELSELVPSINNIDKIINNIGEFTDKDKALELIDSTKQNILGLKLILANYEGIAVENGVLSDDVIKKEKELYKRDRENSKIHWD